MGNQIEFSLRVEFFDDLTKADQPYRHSGYAGSMILDGVTGVCAPRVGEDIRPLSSWILAGRVSSVEHRLGGFAPAPDLDEAESSPSLIAVIKAERPGDNDMDEAVAELEAQGWTWHPPLGRKAMEEARLD